MPAASACSSLRSSTPPFLIQDSGFAPRTVLEAFMNASVHQIYRTTTGPTKARTVSSDQPPLFRAWTDDGNFYGFLFHHLNSVLYSGQHACFCIDFVLGTL